MRTRAIHAGDVVKVSKRGRVFHAHVRGEAAGGQLLIEPIERGISYRHAGAREVVDHWGRVRAGEPADGAREGQLVLGQVLES